MADKISIEAETLAGMVQALLDFKFKLVTPPQHDGRHDVYLAAVARRDRQLEVVRQLLEQTQPLVKNIKPSKDVIDAFS